MIRAFTYTIKDKTPEYYSDFTMNLDLNPQTGQLVKTTNETAVSNALKALCLTNVGERFYHVNIGSKIQAGLFEMTDQEAIDYLQTTIAETIRKNEPRVTVQGINIKVRPEQNDVEIQLSYSLLNIPQVFSTSFFVKRYR